MKKSIYFFVIVMFFMSYQIWACASPDPKECKQEQTQEQTQEQGQIQGQQQEATGIGIGIGTGIANADSNSMSLSNSESNANAIVGVGVNSENNNANINTAFGGSGGQGGSAYTKNDISNANVNAINVSPTINSYTGDSLSAAVNNVEIGDNISEASVGDVSATSGDSVSSIGDTLSSSTSNNENNNSVGDSISDVSMGDINAGNSFSSSYFNSEKLDSYDTSIQVGSVRKSVPNISGYAGMNRYNYRDSWEFGVRVTIPLFTGVTDKAIEYETNKLVSEKNYLDAQILSLSAENERKQSIHTMEINNIQNAYVADRKQITEKHQAEMAVLCKGIKETVKQINGSNELWEICNGFELVTPPVKIVEKKIYIEKKPKPSPCELCEKEKQDLTKF
jgi:hypothetical protein